MPPTRIAFTITELDPGGAERALVQIVSRLSREEWEPRVYCLSGPGEMVAPLEAQGIPVTCLELNSRRPLQAWLRLRDEYCRWRPRIVQTFLYHANLLGRLAARFAHVPVVLAGVRVAERDAPWRMRLDRWTQRLVQKYVCVSNGVAEYMRDEAGIAPERIVVIPNGVDVAALQSQPPVDLTTLGVPAGRRVAVCVGRLHPQKGIDLLLQAAQPLVKSLDFDLMLVGDGPLRETIAAQRDAWDGRLHLAGRQSNVSGILQSSDLLVLPSRWEGMPNIVLEAMAVGCPVLATDVEGIPELLQQGRYGTVVPRNSAAAMAEGLSTAWRNLDRLKTLAAESQHYVLEQFTWDSVAARYADLYRQFR